MMRPWSASILAAMLAVGCGQKPAPETAVAPPPPADATASAPAVEPVTPIDYAKPESWLCRPGAPQADDACRQPATATTISTGGQLTKDKFAPAANPPIDCFYVYPTVSRDETANSDASPGPEEKSTALLQVGRFGSICRIYAPIYRQVTLSALRELLAGHEPKANRDMAYADVKAAWTHYLANDNAGRGVVLIGHDQGAGLLTRLIAAEIDGKPAMDRLVSALLPGTNLAISDPGNGPHTGATGGASFKEIGLCLSNEDIGCAISYAAFRADAPPPAESLFGKADGPGLSAACVNPAELDGSKGQLKAMLSAGQPLSPMAAPGPWTTDGKAIDTPLVMLPGLLSAACVSQGGFSYLAVTLAADPADKRTDTITGDVVLDGKVRGEWGLHILDMNLALGNLVDIVKSQAKSYASREISRAQHPKDDN